MFLLWSFNSTQDFRIHFRFVAYLCNPNECYLIIGDGVDSGNSTRLAEFSDATIPSNVTSISDSAWLKIYTLHIFLMSVEISAIEKSGNYNNFIFYCL